MKTVAKVSNRQIRTAVNHQAAEVDAHRNLLRQVINDELVSRGRIDALEKRVADLEEQLKSVLAIDNRSLARWLRGWR